MSRVTCGQYIDIFSEDGTEANAQNTVSPLLGGVSEKIEFSPFARETLPLALEHAQGA